MSAESRQVLEKARTLPIAEARQSALGVAKTQPITAVVEPAPAQPRRVRPVAPLPSKPMAAVKPEPVKPIEPLRSIPAPAPRPIAEPPRPIAVAPKPIAEAPKPIAVAPKPIAEAPKPIAEAPKPAPAPVKPTASVHVSAPAVRAGMLPPTREIDDGWSQGRKRARVEAARPLRSLKIAEGTQPGVAKPNLSAPPKAAGKQGATSKPAAAAVPAERSRLAEGSLPPPPTSGKPLPSLFSVIDRKKPEPQSDAPSRLPGLPPPPPARPTIGGSKKAAVSSVVAAASLGTAQMAIATTRETQHALVPPPAAMMLDDEDVEELEEIESDLPDFIPSNNEVMRAKSAPTPLFDAPPRAVSTPPSATSFSAAERAFFAAGEEMDTLDMEAEPDTFDDLPGIERPSFWSRLKNRGALAGG